MLELKYRGIKGNWLKNKKARTVVNQALGAMTGRNQDFQILFNRDGFIVIWRIRVSNGRYKYFMWRNSQYATLNDDGNVKKLNSLFGEIARISACKLACQPETNVDALITATVCSLLVLKMSRLLVQTGCAAKVRKRQLKVRPTNEDNTLTCLGQL